MEVDHIFTFMYVRLGFSKIISHDNLPLKAIRIAYMYKKSGNSFIVKVNEDKRSAKIKEKKEHGSHYTQKYAMT